MATTRRGDTPVIEPPEPSPVGTMDSGPTASRRTGSPRPTFDRPAAIPAAEAIRFLWGDEVSGEVSDWIYASTDRIHMLVFALPPGGHCLHSDAHRTVFGADVTYFVLAGSSSWRIRREAKSEWSRPERRSCSVAIPGITSSRTASTSSVCSSFLRRLRRPVRRESTPRPVRCRADSPFGRRTAGALAAEEQEPTLHPTGADTLWRRDGDALVGIVVSTENLTVGTLSLLPGQRSEIRKHGGDECSTSSKGCSTCGPGVTNSAGSSSIRATGSTARPAPHQYFNVDAAASRRRLSGWPRGGASPERDRGRRWCHQGRTGPRRHSDRRLAALGRLRDLSRGRAACGSRRVRTAL